MTNVLSLGIAVLCGLFSTAHKKSMKLQSRLL